MTTIIRYSCLLMALLPSLVFARAIRSKHESSQAQLHLLQPLVTEAEQIAKEQAKAGALCQPFTWRGAQFPGYPLDRLTLHSSCYITVDLVANHRDKKLSGLQVLLQPKAVSGATWVPALQGRPGILAYICMIIPSANTTHAMKPRIEALFAQLPGSLNSCVFSRDTF